MANLILPNLPSRPRLATPRLIPPTLPLTQRQGMHSYTRPATGKQRARAIYSPLTPSGRIPLVPTSDARVTRPAHTAPPRTTNVLPAEGSGGNNVAIDPVLTMSIYLNYSQQGYHATANAMRSLSQGLQQVQQYYPPIYAELPSVAGLTNPTSFLACLEAYENNQTYYAVCGATAEQLSQLEYWFLAIIEPCPSEALSRTAAAREELLAWREREAGKLRRGYSAYCDPQLREKILPLPVAVREYIGYYQTYCPYLYPALHSS
jgi:hypothetical protein